MERFDPSHCRLKISRSATVLTYKTACKSACSLNFQKPNPAQVGLSNNLGGQFFGRATASSGRSKVNTLTFNHGVEGSSPSALTKKSLSRRHFLNSSKCRLGCAQLQIRVGLHLDCTADDDPNPGQDLIHGWRKQNGPRPPVHPERSRPMLRHRQILPPRFGAQRTSCRVYTCAGPCTSEGEQLVQVMFTQAPCRVRTEPQF